MKVENIKIKRVGYGQYKLMGLVNGTKVTVHTTDSTIYDWLEDDENEEKHKTAIRDAEKLLINSFNESYNF